MHLTTDKNISNQSNKVKRTDRPEHIFIAKTQHCCKVFFYDFMLFPWQYRTKRQFLLVMSQGNKNQIKLVRLLMFLFLVFGLKRIIKHDNYSLTLLMRERQKVFNSGQCLCFYNDKYSNEPLSRWFSRRFYYSCDCYL